MTHLTRRRGRIALTAAAVTTASAMALAGCSSPEGAQSENAAITYWLWDSNQQPAYQQCADDFEAESGISVKIEQYGWADYWQGLTTGFASGTAPDVFADHLSYYPEFVGQGQLLGISDRIEADGIDLDIYQDGLADLWQDQEGERYGLPKDFDTVALFYNEQMAAEAGLTTEQLAELEWNTTDGGTFEAAIAALTVDGNGVRGNEEGFDANNVAVYGLALSGNGLNATGQQTWSPFALSNSWYYGDTTPWTTEWNFGADEFVETLTWYKSLQEKGYMPSVDIALSEQDPMNGYLAGRYATVTDGSWMNGSYLGQSDVPTLVAPTPVGPSGERASVFNGLSDGIWAGTDQPDEAWEWVKYLGSAACQDVIAESAVVFPAIKTSTEKATEAFAEKGWDVSGFTVQVDEGTTALLPIADQWSVVNDTISAAVEQFLQGNGDASTLTDANEQVNALFQ
ncbi:ABC transporter substrate-binding protein [Agromyces silvae]|uniref:ABC transporter substrate-binding protein n=1 Tax=Agromyces silvae TaxID=3388266 RepID=UPI00280BAA3C|nr:sugar ABC transporter substrate-binding protein [Agromyces protaetiae]